MDAFEILNDGIKDLHRDLVFEKMKSEEKDNEVKELKDENTRLRDENARLKGRVGLLIKGEDMDDDFI